MNSSAAANILIFPRRNSFAILRSHNIWYGWDQSSLPANFFYVENCWHCSFRFLAETTTQALHKDWLSAKLRFRPAHLLHAAAARFRTHLPGGVQKKVLGDYWVPLSPPKWTVRRSN